ncbi:MAG: septum formation protein Maf [Melioribacteraceae bacterium]|nr:septum formation protein Maf [Melioribacteraceae bacterium]
MIYISYPFYLASKSPRRKQLLQNIIPNIKILKVNLEEEVMKGDTPVDIAKGLAQEKMDNIDEISEPGIILTADTIVGIDNKILGKPADSFDALNMLNSLSGKTHSVITGFCLFNQIKNIKILDFVKTDVTFKKLSEKEIAEYIDTKSPFDKAGAYGIQDPLGSIFVSGINGCYYNVMGLPVSKIYTSLLDII